MSDEDRRCLVVDAHGLVRLGVRKLLSPRFQVDEAVDVHEALAIFTDIGCFDVAVVEVDPPQRTDGKPGGAGVIRTLHRASPATALVAHARRAERRFGIEAIEAGAAGFVAKSSPPEELLRAVEAAAETGTYLDRAARSAGNGTSPLTRRQREILQLLADGCSTDDAALRLGLSAETIRTHTKAALPRLGARDRGHAIAIAMRSGLIE